MSDAATKTCSKCGEVKAVNLASLSKCKLCRNAYWRKLRKSNSQKPPEKARSLWVKWVIKTKNKNRRSGRKTAKENRVKLADTYVRALIVASVGIPSEFVPPELIEVKRKHLQLVRKLKEMNDER